MNIKFRSCLFVGTALLLCCSITRADNVPSLVIPPEWSAVHPQNGTTVVTVVQVVVTGNEAFKDPKSGKDTFQNKGQILIIDPKSGSATAIGKLAYLFTSEKLEMHSILRVTGKLTVSEHQIKGGEYPVTIRVDKWEKINSNKASEPSVIPAPQVQR
jgi:hypothetical protein